MKNPILIYVYICKVHIEYKVLFKLNPIGKTHTHTHIYTIFIYIYKIRAILTFSSPFNNHCCSQLYDDNMNCDNKYSTTKISIVTGVIKQ